MKAAVLHGIGDLKYESVSLPVINDDEVLVKIKYCGICGSDVGRVFVKGTYRFPTIPGHEFSGIVVNDKTGKFLNKRVTVFPLLPCFNCLSCKAEEFATCENYDYYGSRRDGGFAEYLAVKKWNLVLLPDNVDFKVGAMTEPMAVALHATKKLGDLNGKTVLVSGAGPIGLLVGLNAEAIGARNVYYIDIDEKKLKFAESLGFLPFSEKVKADACVEGTGFDSALKKCLDAVKPRSTVVLLGNPSKAVCLEQKDYWNIMRKELTVLGTWNSSFSDRRNDWKDCLDNVKNGVIAPEKLISHIFPLSQIDKAFDIAKNKKEFYNKILIDCDENSD